MNNICYTLAGDCVNPSGEMSGGAAEKSAPILLELFNFREMEQGWLYIQIENPLKSTQTHKLITCFMSGLFYTIDLNQL